MGGLRHIKSVIEYSFIRIENNRSKRISYLKNNKKRNRWSLHKKLTIDLFKIVNIIVMNII